MFAVRYLVKNEEVLNKEMPMHQSKVLLNTEIDHEKNRRINEKLRSYGKVVWEKILRPLLDEHYTNACSLTDSKQYLPNKGIYK